MTDIKKYTDRIRTAIYGKEVRGSLADGIEAINIEVESNTKHVNDTVDDIQHFKDEISKAENIRVNSENSRIEEEKNRINNENIRKSNEEARVKNENSRKSIEEIRNLSESTRTSNENLRKEVEKARSASETIRVTNENSRKSNEETRITNENTRKSNEETRINSEKTRISNEEVRKSNESSRTNKFTELDKQAQGLIAAMKQIVGNIDDRFVTKTATILENADFNTVTTGGFYATVKNTEEHNAPGPYDGRLFVIPWNLGAGVAQMFFEDGGKILYRIAQNNEGTSWTEWKKINNLTPTDIGAQPLESTKFTMQDAYIAVRTANRKANQYYEFWDGDVGWADIKCKDLYTGDGQYKVLNENNFIGKIGDSGYQKFPSGLILQWGNVFKSFRGNQSGSHYIDVNYPVTFPQKAIVAIAIPVLNQYDVGKVKWLCQTNEYNYTNPKFLTFRAAIETGGGETTLGLNWFAIGF